MCLVGEGGLGPKVYVPEMAQINLSLSKFHSFPLCEFWVGIQRGGEGSGGGATPMQKETPLQACAVHKAPRRANAHSGNS